MGVLGTLLTFALVIVAFVVFMGFVVCMVMAVMARREITRTAMETKSRLIGFLPGENCGECGYSTCARYADAAVQGNVKYVPCPRCSDDMNSRISLMWARPKTTEKGEAK